MRNKTLTFFLALFVSFLTTSKAYATPQISEQITIDGKDYSLLTCPLVYCEEAFDSLLLDKYDVSEWECTALWRNYRGFWSIENDKLYLDSIQVGFEGPIIKAQEEDIFKNYLDKGKIWAKWMNDEIKVGSERLLIDYRDTYEHEDFYKLEKGIVKSHRRVENKLLLTSNLAEKNKEAINKWNEFGNTLCDKFPTLKGRFLVRIKYTGCQPNGLPTKVEVELVKYDEEINTDKESLKSLREAISQYSLENIMSNIYEINGKIVSFPMTYPIMLTKEEQ